MAFNLILNSQFTDNTHWKFINCKLENGYLISTNKVFGIEQELVLPDITRLYLRCNYKIENKEINNIKIGIQNNKLLDINMKKPKLNHYDYVSLIDDNKQERIKLHFIFESTIDENKVLIENPLLIDLNHLHRATWLKWILDRTIHYMTGYTYHNEYDISEIKKDSKDFKGLNLEEAKIGSIIKTLNRIEIPLSAKFIKDNYYLIKLDYKEINKFGKVYFEYGILKSIKLDEEQCYLLFKTKENLDLKLIIEGNDVLPYQLNLKHIMIIDSTKLRMLKEDIKYLPFI